MTNKSQRNSDTQTVVRLDLHPSRLLCTRVVIFYKRGIRVLSENLAKSHLESLNTAVKKLYLWHISRVSSKSKRLGRFLFIQKCMVDEKAT